jgi:hypothetical protein
MSTSTSRNHRDPAHEIGVLLLGADWAIAHGEAGGLADVANRLSKCVNEAMCSDLRTVSSLCRHDFEHAVSRWLELRARIKGAANV